MHLNHSDIEKVGLLKMLSLTLSILLHGSVVAATRLIHRQLPCSPQCGNVYEAVTACPTTSFGCACPAILASGAACSQCVATILPSIAVDLGSLLIDCIPYAPTTPTSTSKALPCDSQCSLVYMAVSNCISNTPQCIADCPTIIGAGSACSSCLKTVDPKLASDVGTLMVDCNNLATAEIPTTGISVVAPPATTIPESQTATTMPESQTATQSSTYTSPIQAKSNSGIGSGAIAGIVIGSIVGIACLTALGLFFYTRLSRRKAEQASRGTPRDIFPKPEQKYPNGEPDFVPSGRLQYPE